jgi:hypothetical protein
VEPARCAGAAPSCLPERDVVALCRGARSMTPGYCAAGLRTCSPSQADIQACRAARSEPSVLRIENLTHAGLFLQPHVAIQAHLSLHDQFGQLMLWDSVTSVQAWVKDEGSRSRRLEGSRMNSSVNGTVLFADLKFGQAGVHMVHFSFTAKPEAIITSAHIIVMPTADEAKRIACVYVFLELRSFPAGASAQGVWGQVQAFIPWPISLEVSSCLPVFESSAFRTSPGWGGDTWVSYIGGAWADCARTSACKKLKGTVKCSAGVYTIETGSGLPSPRMSYWQRLDLRLSASEPEVKKAYYKKSLEWHPDRWAQFPRYTEHVQTAFELISEAYEGLQQRAKVNSAPDVTSRRADPIILL